MTTNESFTVQLATYFRQSLLDSERACPNDTILLPALGIATDYKQSKDYCFAVNGSDVIRGVVDQHTTNQLFEIKEKQVKDKKTLPLHQIEIVVFPRVDVLKFERINPSFSKRRVLLPLVIIATLSKNGQLLPTDKAPWIPREWLAPNESSNPTIGELINIDTFLTQTPYENIQTWVSVMTFAIGLLSAAIDHDIDPKKITPDYLSQLSVNESYEQSMKGLILIDPPIIEAKRNIISVLEAVIENESGNNLFENYATPTSASIRPFKSLEHNRASGIKHVGQMTNEFPLSSNQRNALHYLFNQKKGEILAVNGPPGTGKTTLLRSVVANLWTQAALDETDPPIIVAASNNNQAVTNILESFARIEETESDPSIQGRWIPDLKSYGLYLCSQTKAKSKPKPKHCYLSPDNEGVMSNLQTSEYIDKATPYFLNKFKEWKPLESIKNVMDAKKIIHKDMLKIQKEIKNGFLYLKKFQLIHDELEKKYTNLKNLNQLKSTSLEKETAIRSNENQIADAKAFKEKYVKTKKKLTSWISIHKPNEVHGKKYEDQINDICDKTLRFKLFKLATHYWEAKWLVETKQFVLGYDEDKKSPSKLRRKFLRFAKLTPCFVSTFFMVPSFFMAFVKEDDVWKKMPLFDEIDLLIVDESGQALADVSSASFALAKRALIVGDTDQIEPVWNIPPSVDIANLKLSNLITGQFTYEDFWLKSGLLASSGNLMKVAQRRCSVHQYDKLQRGLYLTEHRRCYNNIINYCNDLVYKKILEPLRGVSKTTLPWPSMGFIHSESPSKKIGSSRCNIGEAMKITNWLKINYQQIVTYGRESNPKLQSKNDNDTLLETVAIITPFLKQANLIKQELKKANLPSLTVGTVHTFQGDERRLVLFSSVYGIRDKSESKFYDRSKHLLNVSVSRAKDVFLVFGDSNVFGVGSSETPSGILRKYLIDQ
ncbi:AAA family ATPase [bacterium]|jgi:hypothetical protein|nr:AAA family ATPase [bacterium]